MGWCATAFIASVADDAFGANVDYAMLVKLYGTPGIRRYKPARRMLRDGQGSRLRQSRREAHQHRSFITPESEQLDGYA